MRVRPTNTICWLSHLSRHLLQLHKPVVKHFITRCIINCKQKMHKMEWKLNYKADGDYDTIVMAVNGLPIMIHNKLTLKKVVHYSL